MERDKSLIRNLRLIAVTKGFSAKRKLAAIDYLAELDGIYFLEPTTKEYTVPPERAKAIVTRLLKRLLKEDKKSARVLDRLMFIRGEYVFGLYAAIGDPLHPVKEPTTEPGGISSAVAEVLKKLRRDDGTKNNEVSERAGETQAAV